MALPDFLIIGAMKTGTSSLQAQLAAQPGIFMTTPKEPNFFSDDAVFARGRDWYEGLFAAAAPGDLKGEASTHYTKLPTHPRTVERMRALLPAPKLIYVLRDPLERAISHYLHEWTTGVMGGDPVAAFARHPELVDYGRYALQVAPYVAAYGPDAILLVRSEALKAAPGGELARVGAFLGRDDLRWVEDIAPQNVSAERARPLPFHGLLVDAPLARRLRHALVPKGLRTWVRRRRMPKGRPDLPADLRARLGEVFAADAAELARLLPRQVAEAGLDRGWAARPGAA